MGKTKELYEKACTQFQTDVCTLSAEVQKKIQEKMLFKEECYNNAEMLIQYEEFVKIVDNVLKERLPKEIVEYKNGYIDIHETWLNFNKQTLYVDSELNLTNKEKVWFSDNAFGKKAQETVDAYHVFQKGYDKVLNNLNILKTGAQGEANLYNRLKIIGDKISIIQNARYTMEDGFEVEHDMIVISPVGIFTVEIKNWNKDSYIDEKGYLVSKNGNKANVVEQAMRHKHHLKRTLEKSLSKSFEVHPIIAWVNPDSTIQNEFDKIVVCNHNNIEFEILNHEKYGGSLNKEEREAICRILNSLRIPNKKYPIKLNKEEIVNSLSCVIVGIRAVPKLYEFQMDETGKSILKFFGGIIATIVLGMAAFASFLDDNK